MIREDIHLLTVFLNQHLPNWKILIPDLFNYLDFIKLNKREYLPPERGDIYFVCSGNIGQYQKYQPLAYFETGQPIINSFKRHQPKLKALTESSVLHLARKNSYKLIQEYPGAIELHQEIMLMHLENVEFKARLWNIGKQNRLNAFLNHFKLIFHLIPRNETANFLGISRETLRQSYV